MAELATSRSLLPMARPSPLTSLHRLKSSLSLCWCCSLPAIPLPMATPRSFNDSTTGTAIRGQFW